jgi:hypothetical protein
MEPDEQPSKPVLVKGWPEVSAGGVTMRATADYEPAALEGCPAPGPALLVTVAVSGLSPGETALLTGSAPYDFDLLGCGVAPSPCVWGSDTTEPGVSLCRPEYSQRASGIAKASGEATADDDGIATATLRFVIPKAGLECPAGAGRPWYVEGGTWKVRVTDAAHGLRLAGGQDELMVGP